MAVTERTALVVDDEPQVRSLTCRALTQAGFLCDQASDGAEAFHFAKSKEYDAVVTDLRMPNRHGHALCTDLMSLPKPPNIMVLTALGDARLVGDLLSRGVYDVIQKPVQYDVLAMKVLSMVENGPHNGANGSSEKKKPKTVATNQLLKIETTLHELTELFGDRLNPLFENTDDLPDPPAAVSDFIRRLTESETLGNNILGNHSSRVRERVTCFTTATAVPVDRHWNPVHEPFRVAVRDLSESGLRILHTRATNAEYLALNWRATQLVASRLRIVAQVMRCKPCGRFYDIGGQFTMAD